MCCKLSGRTGKDRDHFGLRLAALIAALFLSVLLAVCVGKYAVTPADCLNILAASVTGRLPAAEAMTVNVVLGLRVPRVLAAVFVGAALALSGAVYQGIFHNPLISPDFLGVSSGACVGAAAAILLGGTALTVQIFSFAGGIAAVAIALLIPAALRNRSHIMLVLSGVIVGAAMSSVLGFLKYVADPDTQLASITYWTMGSFSYIRLDDVFAVLPLMAFPAIVLCVLGWRIDVLSMGSDEARAMGIDVSLLRTVCILSATLVTASSVCIAGTIGWIGLVIPHFARFLAGPDHRRMLPAAMLLGGIFMLAVDTLTRVIGVTEMPVSILTGVIGAPLYAMFLYRERRELS